MLEKILTKLKEQRGTTSNVSDRSLEDLAKSLVPFITTDEQLALANLAPAIASIDGNISHYTKEAITKAEQLRIQKQQQDEAAKKAADEASKKKTEQTKDVPEYVKVMMEQMSAITEQNKSLLNDITSLKTEKITGSRSEKLNAVLTGLPEYLVNPIKAGFQRATFNSDEEFDLYLKDVTTNKQQMEQAVKEQGIVFGTPAKDVNKPVDTGETPIISDARKLINEQKIKNDSSNKN